MKNENNRTKIDSSRFHRVYANLPLGTRDEVCCVLDGEPISFHVAYLEIKQNTKTGDRILEYLVRLEII